MSPEFVVIYTAAGQLQANIVKGMLEASGIPAEVSQESAGITYGFTVGRMGMADVLVPEAYVAQAQQLIEEMQRGQLNTDETVDDQEA